MKKIKIRSLLFLLGFFVLFSVGGTIAYYYQSVALPNEFQTLIYNVDISEEYNDTWGTKKVYITNSDSSNTPVVLRININETWNKVEYGADVKLSNTINGTNVVDKDWTSTFTNDFIDGQDGWFYYKKLLSPNETIQILDSISLNTTLIESSPDYQDYLNFNYKLSINYEALGPNTNKISSIWNKTATIDGINVTWS